MPICVIAMPNGNSKMYDEGTDTEIDWTGSASLTMIVREPSGSSKTGMNLTPFSRIIASRLIEIAKNNRSTSILDKQVTYSNKVTAAMFGFTNGFGSSVRAETSVVDMDQMEDIFDSGINLNESSNSRSRYAMALLGAMSVAAGKTKQNAKLTSDDVEKYTAALAEDIADGTADGKNWTARTVPSMLNTGGQIAYGNGTFVQVSTGPTTIAVTSTDGITWTARTLPSNSMWSGTAFGNGIFVAIAGGSTAAASSTDGITWTARTLPSSVAWSKVAYGNGVFVAVAGGTTAAATSTDGITWTARTMPVSQNWLSIAYGNGVFVATANSSIAATSPDGINWTTRTMPSTGNFWVSTVYGNGIFVSAGGTAAASSP